MAAARGLRITTEKMGDKRRAIVPKKESHNTAEKVVPELRDMYAAARCWLTATSVRALSRLGIG